VAIDVVEDLVANDHVALVAVGRWILSGSGATDTTADHRTAEDDRAAQARLLEQISSGEAAVGHRTL
jgi:hypothetical protein